MESDRLGMPKRAGGQLSVLRSGAHLSPRSLAARYTKRRVEYNRVVISFVDTIKDKYEMLKKG
jgi:hypothetical protein